MDAPATGSCHPVPSDVAEAAVKVLSTGRRTPLKAFATKDLGPLAVDGQAGTLFATLDGVAVAVVPLGAYKTLVAAAMRAAATAPASVPAKATGLSTIERDPEVAEFIQSRFRGGVTIEQIRDACRNAFGEERTPSRDRINRFRDRLRKCR